MKNTILLSVLLTCLQVQGGETIIDNFAKLQGTTWPVALQPAGVQYNLSATPEKLFTGAAVAFPDVYTNLHVRFRLAVSNTERGDGPVLTGANAWKERVGINLWFDDLGKPAPLFVDQSAKHVRVNLHSPGTVIQDLGIVQLPHKKLGKLYEIAVKCDEVGPGSYAVYPTIQEFEPWNVNHLDKFECYLQGVETESAAPASYFLYEGQGSRVESRRFTPYIAISGNSKSLRITIRIIDVPDSDRKLLEWEDPENLARLQSAVTLKGPWLPVDRLHSTNPLTGVHRYHFTPDKSEPSRFFRLIRPVTGS